MNRSTRAMPSDTGALAGFLESEQVRIDEMIASIAREHVPSMAEPLRGPVEYALSTTGKRLRPILCISAYRAACGGVEASEAVYQMSCALEVVHTYSLIHDDLPCMDDDDLRRGRPTVHRVYGNARAVLAGAALLPLAMEVLDTAGTRLDLMPAERARLVVELANAAGAEGMVGGQLLDLEAEHRTVDAAELESIHARKTGALLTASLRIGAIAARATEELLHALTVYGKALGLAFQITDDLLDVEGSSAELGKVARRDLALAKASYPALHGVEGARALARKKIDEAREAIAPYGLRDLQSLAEYVVDRRK